jgi:hypothetical protein
VTLTVALWDVGRAEEHGAAAGVNTQMGTGMDRRTLLQSAAAAAGLVALDPLGSTIAGARGLAPAAPGQLPSVRGRWAEGREVRRLAIENAYGTPMPTHETNGEEEEYPAFLGSYSKGLPHDPATGEVDRRAYRAWQRALSTGNPADFERVPKGVSNARPQLGPQGGLGFNLMGPDPWALPVPPAPRLDSPRLAAEMAEMYWYGLTHDIPFAEYDTHPLIAEACADLSTYSDYGGPTEDGRVTPRTIFRGQTPGDLAGPLQSQLMVRDIPYGTLGIANVHDTVETGVVYGTGWDEFVALQNGAPRTTSRNMADRRYLHTGRQMAHYTHFDILYQPYLTAALILLGTPGAYPSRLQDRGNPYLRSTNQVGFPTFGTPHLMTLITDVCKLAIMHTMAKQFFIHRRVRPEGVAGRIHVQLERDPGRYDGVINGEILESAVLGRVHDAYGTYLLPCAFPEGSPMSPAYQSGHTAVAGAGATILKAWFDEDFVFEEPVVPSPDGTSLVPWTGGDTLTLGGEVNKLAANIGTGRAFGGVHYRSDNEEGYLIGEKIALAVLRDQAPTYNEQGSFTVTTFAGETVTI